MIYVGDIIASLMCCPSCIFPHPNFITPCGHHIHAQCLQYLNYRCPKCGRAIKTFEVFHDILMNMSEAFFIELSGCSDWKKGIIMWLIDNHTEGLISKEVLDRYSLFFENDNSFERILLEEALLRDDLRLAKKLLISKSIEISKYVLETTWKRDHIETLAEAFDLGMVLEQDYSPIYNVDLDPLMVAAKTGNYTILKRVIAKGVNLNRISLGRSAFHRACMTKSFSSMEEDRVKFLDFMLDHGSHICFPRSRFRCPFMDAVENKNVKLVEYLLSKGGKPKNGSMALAIENSSFEMVKLLHDCGVKFNGINSYKSPSSLRLACKNRAFNIVKYILESGVSLEGVKTTLKYVIKRNMLGILVILLSYGIQPSYEKLKTACFKGNFEMVRLLIEYGADPRGKDQTSCMLLHDFNFESSIDDEGKLAEIIEFFLRIGADFDARDVEDNQTVLYKLCRRDKNLPIIKKLLRFGANIHNIEKQYAESAFLKACRNGCPDVVRILVRNGADMKECNENVMNCYLAAILSGNLETVKITRALSDKNFVDKNGNGPFFYIRDIRNSEDKVLKIFDYLSKERVNMNILNNQGHHPLIDKGYMKKEFPSYLVKKYFENEENRIFALNDIFDKKSFLYRELSTCLDIHEEATIELVQRKLEHVSIKDLLTKLYENKKETYYHSHIDYYRSEDEYYFSEDEYYTSEDDY